MTTTITHTIIEWDHLEDAVDRLAATIDHHLHRQHDHLICGLDYPEVEAIAAVLDAGHHADIAGRLVHRWALTEPDWNTHHGDSIRHWLHREHHPEATP